MKWYHKTKAHIRRAIAGPVHHEHHTTPYCAIALSDLPIIFLDLETTGLDVTADRVVQIGMVRGLGPDIEDHAHLDSLVNPGIAIPPRSTRIHGITDRMVSGQQTIETVWPMLRMIVTDAIIIGHQIGFDLAVLRHEADRHGLDRLDLHSLDLVRLDAALNPRINDHSLDHLAHRLSVDIQGRHSAIGDALTAALCWQAMLPDLEARGVSTYRDACLFEAQARHIIRKQRRAGW